MAELDRVDTKYNQFEKMAEIQKPYLIISCILINFKNADFLLLALSFSHKNQLLVWNKSRVYQ